TYAPPAPSLFTLLPRVTELRPSQAPIFQSRAILDAISHLPHPHFSIKVWKNRAPRGGNRASRRRNRATATWCGNCAPWERNRATRGRIARHPKLAQVRLLNSILLSISCLFEMGYTVKFSYFTLSNVNNTLYLELISCLCIYSALFAKNGC